MGRLWHFAVVSPFALFLSGPTEAQAPACPQSPFCVLHSFTGDDGENPGAGVTASLDGKSLYGTTFGDFGDLPVKRCSKSCGTLYTLQADGSTISTELFDGNQQGAHPEGEVAVDESEVVYGTTEYGPGIGCGGLGCGTIFQQGVAEPVFGFGSAPELANGAFPEAGLLAHLGILYGTAKFGGNGDGSYCASDLAGCGTVYGFDPSATTNPVTTLHNFCSAKRCKDGAVPRSRLIFWKGYLYGTTEFGGRYREGTIFRLKPDGSRFRVIHDFCGAPPPAHGDGHPDCVEGSEPQAGLAVDSAGNLYGTTSSGGNTSCTQAYNGCGVLFELSPGLRGSWSFTLLHTFQGSFDLENGKPDGAVPESQLALDSRTGALYGATLRGGSAPDELLAGGTVYRYAPAADEYSIVYEFCTVHGNTRCFDGSRPHGALLIQGGYLYGTTRGGGLDNDGVVYKIDLSAVSASDGRRASKSAAKRSGGHNRAAGGAKM